MLRELKITNLALIEALHITFADHLTALTGETGAGKSIILQAIHLLSGGKAATSWIRSGAETAVVEALFELASDGAVAGLVRERGFDTDGTLIIKRVLGSKGKSRFYLNGGMATAKVIGELAEHLLSVSSQHDHQLLLAPRHHLDVLDALGDHWQQRAAFAGRYTQWLALKKEFTALSEQERDKEQRRDFLAFQCREIDEAGLAPGEDEALDQEKNRLKAADDLLRLGGQSHELLAAAVADGLARVRKNLEEMAAFDPSLAALSEAVAGHSFELEDRAAELRNYLEEVAVDPARLEEVTARIDLVQRLKRKYGATVEEVLEHGEEARQELAALDRMDDRLAAMKAELEALEAELCREAGELSAARRRTAEQLAVAVEKELHTLCIEHALFEVAFEQPDSPGLDDLSPGGWDRPAFQFSANPGEPPKPLAKIASGGELSRLMLALKTLLARKDLVETVIFDEVDAGISGQAAEAVGSKIRHLAGHHQVLCITHLPQIAARADQHFRVEKQVNGNRTLTTISELAAGERVDEIARMLAGDSVTAKTVDYAREMLGRNA